ncbi:MAG: hypothetical protein E6J11_18530 [Chloroflexi bacterium]|nr:MAG: hypothetical protein E6J11_18530 [Chloroflexota bacterium]
MWPRFATFSPLRCSFCDKPKEQVEQLLAGPRGVSICTTCVDGCQQTMRDASRRSSQSLLLHKPCSILHILRRSLESKAKECDEGGREAVERDRKRGSVGRGSIASQALLPREAIMGALGAGHHFFAWLGSLLRGLGWSPGKGHHFAADQLEPLPPEPTAGPISPYYRGKRRRLRQRR